VRSVGALEWNMNAAFAIPRYLALHRLRLVFGTFAALAALSLPAISYAEYQCSVVSPEQRVALVELYTSEGCSSCPPADKWLSALTESGLSTSQVLPLSIHVDYWDYIGWKDRFADPRYTKRQREHAVNNRLRSIYTPQVVTSGKDTRDWYRASAFLSRVKRINDERSPLAIELSANHMGSSAGRLQVKVGLNPVAAAGKVPARASLHLMVYENGLSSEVSRGENAGELLTHERVVRAWAQPQALNATMTDSMSFEQIIRLPDDALLKNLGVAAFVEDAEGGIVQATQCQLQRTS